MSKINSLPKCEFNWSFICILGPKFEIRAKLGVIAVNSLVLKIWKMALKWQKTNQITLKVPKMNSLRDFWWNWPLIFAFRQKFDFCHPLPIVLEQCAVYLSTIKFLSFWGWLWFYSIKCLWKSVKKDWNNWLGLHHLWYIKQFVPYGFERQL